MIMVIAEAIIMIIMMMTIEIMITINNEIILM